VLVLKVKTKKTRPRRRNPERVEDNPREAQPRAELQKKRAEGDTEGSQQGTPGEDRYHKIERQEGRHSEPKVEAKAEGRNVAEGRKVACLSFQPM